MFLSQEQVVAHYEEVRERVIAGLGGVIRSRHVIARLGLLQWGLGWAQEAVAAVTPRPTPVAPPLSSTTDVSDEVTMVLATMTLHCMQEAAL